MNLFDVIEKLDEENQLLIALSILAHIANSGSAGAIYSKEVKGKSYSMILLVDEPGLEKEIERMIAESTKFSFKNPDVPSQN
jgi:hypothetical protein